MKRHDKQMALAIAAVLALATTGFATQPQNDPQKPQPQSAPSSQDKKNQKPPAPGERLEPDDTPRPSDMPDDVVANRQEQLAEEAAINPYYNNFFNSYRLGPEDVISVDVFNQERYSRKDITVPPSGRISLSLIPGGVFVNGKTVEQVAETITKAYSEYILNPQVTVSLDKASSYRYSIIGDVGQPGIRLMSHRLTVTEAIAGAGGVLSTGDKSKVVVLRRQADGHLAQIPVNLSAIYKGRVADNVYLVPGDQIVVPGNKLKKIKELLGLTQILSFARVFGVPVP